MFTIQNVTLLNDIMRLPRESLHEISTDLNIPTDCPSSELAVRIWERLNGNGELQNRALEPYRNKVLCGKTSVTWYHLSEGATLQGAKRQILENCGFNPFETVQVPEPENLTSTPVLISAAPGEDENEYYLRFMHKSGMARNIFGTQMNVYPNTDVKTVYVKEAAGCIEVRTDARSAGKFATSLARLVRQQITISQTDIMAPFGNNIERIADALGGEFIDVVSKPELFLEDITEAQANAVVGILTALDGYFLDDNFEGLQENLQEARNILSNSLNAIPFTALMLNGLEKVGMGAAKELRGHPLYEFLRPRIQHQGGYIQFQIPEDGVVQTYTIRVGIRTNSIQFLTPATENAINHVRECIIIR